MQTSKKQLGYFLAAFVLIFTFRLVYGLWQNNFSQDTARDLVLTANNIERKNFFPGYGPKASVGNFYLLPAYYQTHLVLSLLTDNHPFTMKFFVIVLESMTPILLYLILKELKFDKKITLGLAFLYTISPLVTIFASFAWNPNTLPFFSSLALLLMIRYLKYGEKIKLIFLPLLYCLAIHLHLQAVVLLLFFAIFNLYVLLKRRSDYKFLIIGYFIALLTILPYLMTELQNNWPNTQAIIHYFSAEHSQYFDRVSKPAFILTFIPAFIERVVSHQEFPYHYLGRLIFILPLIILPLGILKTIIQRKKLLIVKEDLDLIVLLYFLSILMMLRIYKGDKIDYYMSTLFVLPSIFLAYIYRFNKILTIFLIAVGIFTAGNYYAKLERSDQYADRQLIVDFIEKEANLNPVQLLFYNYDDINTFSYLLEQNDIDIDQESLLLVEFCPKITNCSSSAELCRDSRQLVYTSLLKESGYQNLASYVSPLGYKIYIGRLRNLKKPSYNLYNYNFAYGSDLLKGDYSDELKNF